jgi:hypothetical protein
MKKFLFSALFILITGFSLFSQNPTWEKTIFKQEVDLYVYSIKTDETGNSLLTGQFDSIVAPYLLQEKAFTAKIDPYGNTVWFHSFPGDFMSAVGKGIALTKNNDGCVITGVTLFTDKIGSLINFSLMLRKYNKNGTASWNKVFYDENHPLFGESIDVTADSGYIIAGSRDNCLYLLRTDKQGDSIWSKTHCNFIIQDPEPFKPNCKIIQTADLGYILCRTSMDEAEPQAMQIIKFGPEGDTVWSHKYNSGEYSEGYSIIQAQDGNYLACGLQNALDLPGYLDAKIIKIDQEGGVIWEKTYDRFGFADALTTIKEVAPSEFVAAGSTTDPNTGEISFAYLVRIDASGDTLWTRTDGEGQAELTESIRDMDLIPESGFVLGGNIRNSAFIARLTNTGEGFVEISNPEKPADEWIHLFVTGKEIRIEDKSSATNNLHYSVAIYNEMGQSFYSTSIPSGDIARIDIGDLSPGIYIVKVSCDTKTKTLKFSCTK